MVLGQPRCRLRCSICSCLLQPDQDWLALIDFLQPPKKAALAYLDGDGPKPQRFGCVTTVRGTRNPPDCMDYQVVFFIRTRVPRLQKHCRHEKSAEARITLWLLRSSHRLRLRYTTEAGHLLQVGPVEVLLGRTNGSAYATPLTAPGQVPWVKHPQTPAWMATVVGPVRVLALLCCTAASLHFTSLPAARLIVPQQGFGCCLGQAPITTVL